MSKIKENMLKLKLSPKREYAKLAGVCASLIALGLIISFLIKSWLYLGIGAGLSAIVLVYLLSSYGSQLDKINKENTEEFVNLFSYFKIYIHNGYNVYSSLVEIKNFASPNLKELLSELKPDAVIVTTMSLLNDLREICKKNENSRLVARIGKREYNLAYQYYKIVDSI